MKIELIEVRRNQVVLKWEKIQITYCFFNENVRIEAKVNVASERNTYVPPEIFSQMGKRAKAILMKQREKLQPTPQPTENFPAPPADRQPPVQPSLF